jgi:UDP-2-acetamido-2,6-beta-L-arabino-hexul-4-ose reductase
MKSVLITGANGFIGKNLGVALMRRDDINILSFDINNDPQVLETYLKQADIIYHLAGINRPESEEEFYVGNVGLTKTIVDILERASKGIKIVFASSVQAVLDNPYGISKKKAEDILIEYSRKNRAKVYIYRLPNVFGKWCKPNYNSVVATFCYNVSHGLNISISDEKKMIELVYIDDVVNEFISLLDSEKQGEETLYHEIPRKIKITLGELAERIYQLRDIRSSLVIPDLADYFMKCLHATYVSYLDKDKFSYPLIMKRDDRGWLTELIKSRNFGQIFISKTNKGIIRGNHYHNSKIEKFCVLQGKAVIKFRHVLNNEILTYYVSGDEMEIVDIPPGYTHSIENLGDDEIVVLFWANQIFNPEEPDTYYCEVDG